MQPVHELRFAFTVDDYDGALQLFRDIFGLEPIENFEEGKGRGTILKVPSATLELFNAAYTDHVDDIEVGRRLGERFRIAVKVDDVREAAEAVRGMGAGEMAAVVDTPWGDRNHRFRTKEGMQMTLFESPG